LAVLAVGLRPISAVMRQPEGVAGPAVNSSPDWQRS
jgi:hypothetical protein